MEYKPSSTYDSIQIGRYRTATNYYTARAGSYSFKYDFIQVNQAEFTVK